MKTPPPIIRIDRAIEAFETQTALAAWFGITQSAVSVWVKRGLTHLPARRAYELAASRPELVDKPETTKAPH